MLICANIKRMYLLLLLVYTIIYFKSRYIKFTLKTSDTFYCYKKKSSRQLYINIKSETSNYIHSLAHINIIVDIII